MQPHVNTFTPFYSNHDRASLSMPLLDSNMEDSVSSPSSNGDPVGCGNGDGDGDSLGGWRPASVESVESGGGREEEGFGPLYGEEEDLRRAIELSLREQRSSRDTAGEETMATCTIRSGCCMFLGKNMFHGALSIAAVVQQCGNTYMYNNVTVRYGAAA